MKLQRYLMAGLVVLAAVLQSCEKDVANFDISSNPMLVTTAFISPQDTVLAVEVKRTQPAIGRQRKTEELRVPDAIVTLSDGSQTVQLEYNQERDKYYAPISSLSVAGGKTYFLKVTTPAGEKAEANSTVPVLNGVQVTELNYEAVPTERYGYKMIDQKITFKWQDAPEVENYYHLSGYRTYQHQYGYPPVVATQHEAFYTDNAKIFATDAKQNGKVMQSPDFMLTSVEADHAPKPFKVIAVLAVTDKAYYDYHQSILKQDDTGGNPFAEPQRIYTNMQGSLGVFAAYNQIKVMQVIQ